jgi:hypothetical protein
MMIKILGGKTIDLDEDLGVVEGQEVEVQVTMIHLKKRVPGPPPAWQPDRPSTTAGRLAESWTAENDRILDAIYRDRQREIPIAPGERGRGEAAFGSRGPYGTTSRC